MGRLANRTGKMIGKITTSGTNEQNPINVPCQPKKNQLGFDCGCKEGGKNKVTQRNIFCYSQMVVNPHGDNHYIITLKNHCPMEFEVPNFGLMVRAYENHWFPP